MARVAYYYGRNNYLVSQLGPSPGTIFATIQEGLKELARASLDAFRSGIEGERLRYERVT
jgi:hypothetical protein